MLIDWLNFTFKDWEAKNDDSLNSVALFLKYFPEFKDELESGTTLTYSNGIYQVTVALSEFMYLHYDVDNRHKGVNIEIPSHGLSHFFEIMRVDQDPDPVESIFKILFNRYCQLSRLDVAFDDYDYKNNKFTADWYAKQWHYDNIKSRCRSFSEITSGKGASTVYFGNRNTGKMLRIYDKFLESNGEVDAVRYEVELHSHYCNQFAQDYIDNKVTNFGELLLSFISVIDHFKCPSNKSMCPMLPEWETWLNLEFSENIKPLTFPHPKKDSTYFFEKKYEWLNNTALNSIVYLYHCLGALRFSRLYRDFDIDNLPAHYKKALENFKLKQGLLDLERGE